MKILYLTPHAPSLDSGGGRHCYANLLSLCEYEKSNVDYIGPIINDFEHFRKFNFNVISSRNFTSKDRLLAAIKGSPTSLIEIFSEAKTLIDFRSYDLVFVEFSYINFIFDYLPSKTPTVFMVHNIEADYQNFNCKGVDRLKYFYTKKCEKQVIQTATNLLLMHNFDLQRLKSLYGVSPSNYCLHPVCSFAPSYESIDIEKRDKTILFSGSLNNRYNELGLIEFLNSCWKEIQEDGYTLLIAGRDPSAKLLTEISHYKNTQIFINPMEMQSILRRAKLMVLPDLFGTGMKLRVAEALSYGVPIVGTELGLRGYEDIQNYGFTLETIKDMSVVIQGLVNSAENLKKLSTNAYETWKYKYSFDIFRSRLHSFLRHLQ